MSLPILLPISFLMLILRYPLQSQSERILPLEFMTLPSEEMKKVENPGIGLKLSGMICIPTQLP